MNCVGVRKVKRVQFLGRREWLSSERDALFVLKALTQHLRIFSRFPNPSQHLLIIANVLDDVFFGFIMLHGRI